MVTITYDALNDLVHEVGEAIEKTTGLGKDGVLDLFALNDTITEYLGRYGVQYEDEEKNEAHLEAIANIRLALARIGPRLGQGDSDLEEAAADLEQAVRFLRGEEEPA